MKDCSVNIALINPKSPENVGSVMRAAGNFRIDSVIYTGERYQRALNLKAGSVDMGRKVSQKIPLSSVSCLMESIPKDMKRVCVEFVEHAIPLPEYKHPNSVIYIFGPEDGSISQELIDFADEVVYVPTIGCMNLAATVNVVLYDRLAKDPQGIASNELIYQSRDINNNLTTSS
ncbi:MAG: TrmH family RNA methyltransferase [Methyloprofundus sp.]|nr:TrmH family RNA methyltransferase [Methyloprofundus sp.]